MTVQEVAKAVMKISQTTQQEVAEQNGLAGQSSVGTFLRSKSMRVENLLMILNTCGYELVARSADSERPEFVIGESLRGRAVIQKAHAQEQTDQDAPSEEDRLAEMIRKAVAAEIAKVIPHPGSGSESDLEKP